MSLQREQGLRRKVEKILQYLKYTTYQLTLGSAHYSKLTWSNDKIKIKLIKRAFLNELFSKIRFWIAKPLLRLQPYMQTSPTGNV